MLVGEAPSDDRYAVVGGKTARAFSINLDANTFRLLSDTLYPEKIKAVVREILCNAIDAHIAAGKADEPVIVTLADHEFTVTDTGTGIPDAKMSEIYCTYMGSTKKADAAQTGGFGLGTKSPLAYTDHFTVTSRHDGIQTVYVIHQGTEESGGAPILREMVSGPTENAGLTVSVPLKSPSDRAKFKEWVERIAEEGGMRVMLNGELIKTPNLVSLEPGQFQLLEKTRYDSSIDTMRILYGNVQYPVPRDIFGEYFHTLSNYFNNSFFYIAFRMPPNSVSLVPSREALSYDEKTIASVRRVLKSIVTDLAVHKGRVIRSLHDAHIKKVTTLPSNCGLGYLHIDEFPKLNGRNSPSQALDDAGSIRGAAALITFLLTIDPRYRAGGLSASRVFLMRRAMRRIKGIRVGKLVRRYELSAMPMVGGLAFERMRNIVFRAVRDVVDDPRIYFSDGWRLRPARNVQYAKVEPTLVVAHTKLQAEMHLTTYKHAVYLVAPGITNEQFEQIAARAGRFRVRPVLLSRPVKEKKKPTSKEVTSTATATAAPTFALFNVNDAPYSYVGASRRSAKFQLSKVHTEDKKYMPIRIADPVAHIHFPFDKNGMITMPLSCDNFSILVQHLYPKTVIPLSKSESDDLVRTRNLPSVTSLLIADLAAVKNKKLFLQYVRMEHATERNYGFLRRYRMMLHKDLSLMRELAHLMCGLPYKPDNSLDRLFVLAFSLRFFANNSHWGFGFTDINDLLASVRRVYDDAAKLDFSGGVVFARVRDLITSEFPLNTPADRTMLIGIVKHIAKTTKENAKS